MATGHSTTTQTQGAACQPQLSPRVYWTMVRDLLDEALSFAVTLRSAPYESVDDGARRLLLEAADQLVDAALCVLDAVETSVGPDLLVDQHPNVHVHPCLARLRGVTAESRVRLAGRRSEIRAAMNGAPVWRLADAVSDARLETIRALENVARACGAPLETRRRFRTYWDEHVHYAAIASRATRRLAISLEDLLAIRSVPRRLEACRDHLARLVSTFEFTLLRQSNRRKVHALLERLRDTHCGGSDELAQRRLWNDCMVLVHRVAEDQAARAVWSGVVGNRTPGVRRKLRWLDSPC